MNTNRHQSPELHLISNLYSDWCKRIKRSLEGKNSSNLKAYEWIIALQAGTQQRKK